MSSSHRPASARKTPVSTSNDRIRSARTVETTSWSGAAGSDESPYERPRPRDSGRPSAMRARSSERPSCPGTTGARPQPDSVSPLRPNTPPIYQGCGATTDSARDRSIAGREGALDASSAARLRRAELIAGGSEPSEGSESGATGGEVSPAELLDQRRAAHPEQLGCLFLVE